MDRLYSLAMGIPFAGRSYTTLECILLHKHRRTYTGDLLPCDVYQGFRTRAREHFANLWDRGPHGFVRRADPLHPGPYIHYGWQAPPVRGGACGGLLFPDGLLGHLGLKVRLRRTRSFLEEVEPCFHYKLGVEAACGALGTRLVPPKLWSPVPPEHLQLTKFVSSDGRFLNVRVRWV